MRHDVKAGKSKPRAKRKTESQRLTASSLAQKRQPFAMNAKMGKQAHEPPFALPLWQNPPANESTAGLCYNLG
jgi:hypothetical protein